MKIPWYLMAKGKGGGTKTASGPIAHWTDGVDAPLKSLLVNIDPVQDLHGYDSPWPAGGGKNKFDVSKMVNTSDITINNGVISVTGNSKNSGKKLSELADLTVGETYILTANTTGTENIIYLYGTGANVRWAFGTSKTMTQEMLDALVFFYGGSNTTSQFSNFMIRLASISDATFAPYSNICPISGWDGMTVYHSGADTSAPTTYPITWQSAGTVYGGTLDVTNGVLTVDMACRTFATFEGFSVSDKLVKLTSDSKPVGNSEVGNIIASYLSATYANNIWAYANISGVAGNPAGYIYARIAGLSTAEEYSDYLASNPLQVCYELATPIEYTLTPQQISSLVGENNVWADTGDVTVEYESSGGSDPNLMKLAVAFMGRE